MASACPGQAVRRLLSLEVGVETYTADRQMALRVRRGGNSQIVLCTATHAVAAVRRTSVEICALKI